MLSSRSDVDDVIIGPDFAIVAKGDRRWMLNGLTREQLAALSKPQLRNTAIRALTAGLAAEFDGAPHGHSLLWLPSRAMSSLSKPWVGLTAPVALGGLGLIVGAASLLVAGVAPDMGGGPSVLPTGIVLVLCIMALFGSLFVHEVGHAAACLRATGATGGLRGHLSGKGLRLSVDVSSQVRAPPLAQLAISASGPIFQAVFAALTGIAGLATTTLALVFTGCAILLLAIANIVPAGSNDGAVAIKLLWAGSEAWVSTERSVGRILSLIRAVILLGAAILTVLALVEAF